MTMTVNNTFPDGMASGVSSAFSNGLTSSINSSFVVSRLDIASATTLGGVKVGSGLSVSSDGTLSVDRSQIHEVPEGGEANQVIKKLSSTDYDYGWGDSVIIEAYGSSLTIS